MKLIRAGLAALAVTIAPAPMIAQEAAGAYLAARQAGLSSDYTAASQFYLDAMLADPGNPNLMESAIASQIGAAQVDQAVIVAKAMEQAGLKSQLADMVLTAGLAKAEDYTGILNSIEAGREIGPLVDGLLQAWSHVGQGQMARALDDFDDVTAAPGLRAFGLYHKALALASVGDFEDADAVFVEAQSGQRTRRATLAHTQVLSQLDRNDDALRLMTAVFGNSFGADIAPIAEELRAGAPLGFSFVTSPTDGIAEVFFSVAGALDGEMEPDFTLIYTRIAEHLRSDHIEALLLSARLLEELGQFDLATQAYDSVPRSDPAYHAAELGRSAALRRAGRSDAAIEVLTQLAETHGDLPQVHQALADGLRRDGDYDAANASYSTALSLFAKTMPFHWRLYFHRAVTFERLGNWSEAEADLRQSLALNPSQPEVLNYLGYSLVERQEKIDEALTLIERAAAERPDTGFIIDSLGWVLYRRGEFEQAVTHLERASELEPVDPVVNDHLGDAYWAVGRETEARFQWSRALSFDPTEDDAERIRLKLELGLDEVLLREGAPAIQVANDDS